MSSRAQCGTQSPGLRGWTPGPDPLQPCDPSTVEPTSEQLRVTGVCPKLYFVISINIQLVYYLHLLC